MTRRSGRLIFRQVKRAAIFAALFVCAPMSLPAQEMTVLSRTGGMEISGDYLGFDGRYLRMETAHGEVTVDYASVTCTGDVCPDEGHVPVVQIAGARRMGEVLLPALVEGFALSRGYEFRREEWGDDLFDYVLTNDDEGEQIRFRFRLSSTDAGFVDLLEDRADLVMSVREVRAEERQQALDAGLGDLSGADRSRIIALDGLVPIVSAAQDRRAIALEDLAAAFAGEIADWEALGGPAGPIGLHLMAHEDGQAQGFVDEVLGVAGVELSDSVQRHRDAGALAAAVSEDPGALGVVPYQLNGDARALAVTGRCGLSSVAELQTLKTEDYPLTMPLFLYQPMRRLPPLGTEFLAWLRTSRAHFIVRRAGFVDLGADPIPIDDQGRRFAGAILAAGEEVGLADLKRMVRAFEDKQRLSTTFRFEVGSTRLDAQSRSNIYQLAREIADGVHSGETLLLAGFSDGNGPAVANRALAAARAESVLRNLVAALGGTLPDRVRIRTMAFGEALPMGCDDTEWGRQTNRRVELWVDR